MQINYKKMQIRNNKCNNIIKKARILQKYAIYLQKIATMWRFIKFIALFYCKQCFLYKQCFLFG